MILILNVMYLYIFYLYIKCIIKKLLIIDFVKVRQGEINNSNFKEYISHNCVKSNYIQTLLKMLDDYYNPKIYSDNSWPENVKKEFIA